MGYNFHCPSASTTFRLHELQGGTTSFEDFRLRSPPEKNPGSRLFQRFTARRASFGTVSVMNSRAFTDSPYRPKAIRVVRNPISSFTDGGAIVASTKREAWISTFRGGGLLRHALAIGAEIFRSTVAFLLGRRLFSSSDITAHPFFFFSGSTRHRLGFGASIASRRSPSSLQPLPEGSDFRAPCFSDPSERIGRSAVKGHPLSLEAFAATHGSSLPPCFFRSTDGGRIPPGCYPSLFAPALASVHAEEFALLPVHWMAAPFP